VDAARGPDVIDLLVRNPERFTGRKGIPFAEVLERELTGLERSRRADPIVLEVARRLFATGTSQALYRRNLGIELINGKGDGAHFRTVESLLRTSAGGAWRVVVIDDAHKMTDAAENAFLKTLEEPPSGTVIVLVTAEPYALLPTTLSRCARVVFRSLPTPELARFLVETQGVAPAEGTLLATLADGSLGAALALRGCDLVARRRAIEGMLPGIAEGDLARILGQVGARLGGAGERSGGGRGARGAGGAARDAVRAEARLLLELLALCFRDLILLRSMADAGEEAAGLGLLSGMEADFAHRLAARRSAREWETLFRRTETAAEDVALSVEPRLAVEALFTDTLTPVGRTA
jgi:hypothetical protein